MHSSYWDKELKKYGDILSTGDRKYIKQRLSWEKLSIISSKNPSPKKLKVVNAINDIFEAIP